MPRPSPPVLGELVLAILLPFSFAEHDFNTLAVKERINNLRSSGLLPAARWNHEVAASAAWQAAWGDGLY
jgi:hypothetical protein